MSKQTVVTKRTAYAVYTKTRGTTYQAVLTRGSYADCLRWRSEQPKPPRGTRLIVAPHHLMNR